MDLSSVSSVSQNPAILAGGWQAHSTQAQDAQRMPRAEGGRRAHRHHHAQGAAPSSAAATLLTGTQSDTPTKPAGYFLPASNSGLKGTLIDTSA